MYMPIRFTNKFRCSHIFSGFIKLSFFISAITVAGTQAYASTHNLELVKATYQEVAQERVLDALVEAVNKATISAQTSGRVSNIYFDVNDYVKKGAVLLRMRNKDQQAKLNVEKANFEQAETELNRVQELFQKNLVSKSKLDKAQSGFKSSRARLDQAQENMKRTIVHAPYSGIVVKRHIEVGETARVGAKLFTGISLESLRVVVNLPQDIISIVRQQKSARILILANNKSIASTSMTISPYADAKTHTFLIRVNLPLGDHGLYPGMAVKVAFAIGKSKRLQLPLAAVTHRSEVTAVYVMDDKNKISMRQIRAGHSDENGMIEILSGLQENEQVALDPVSAASYLKEQNVVNHPH